MGVWALAAEAMSSAAEAYRSEGLVRLANAAQIQAGRWLDQCAGTVAPGVVTSGDAARLTRRELEVAALAARNLSSREIADRLFLSVRTVDNHLQRVYAKLGVTSRDELADALG
jgi:DNA-binding CsgD family transcriptional regulator